MACDLPEGACWTCGRVRGWRLEGDGLWPPQEMRAVEKEDCSWCSVVALGTSLGNCVYENTHTQRGDL